MHIVRVAVIIPRHRHWRWHQALIADLARHARVDVFVDDRAPPYPALLRMWLALERLVFSTQETAWPATPDPSWQPATELKPEESVQVVNLAEYPLGFADVLEVRYEGTRDTRVLIDLLLSRRTPVISVGPSRSREPSIAGRPAIEDKLLLTRALHFAFARSLSLVKRALAGTARSLRSSALALGETPPATGAFRLPAFIAHTTADKLSKATLHRVRRRGHWSVALRCGNGPFRVVADDTRRYYADPFLFSREGRTFLFVEEVPYATGKGVISVAEVIGDRLAAAPAPVLERPYHLSYPFVLSDRDAVYMLPESGANASLELYRAVEFPWRWELDRTLMEGLVLADATPLFHKGRWWLFAAVAEHGGGGHDELHIFHSDSLSGPWVPHAGNPVKSDCRSARPAGRFVETGGRLFRPAQDCDESYGAGLVWLEITELTPDRFDETEVARWCGRAALGVDGLHTVDHLGLLQVIDIKRDIGLGVFRRSADLLPPLPGGELDATAPSLTDYLGRRAAGFARRSGSAC